MFLTPKNVSLMDIIWSPNIWLPSNLTWDHIKSNSKNTYPECSHLLYPFMFAFILLAIKNILDRNIFQRMGKFLCISYEELEPTLQPYKILKEAYNSTISEHKLIKKEAQILNWSEKDIKDWLRMTYHQKNIITKFCHSSWNCIRYSYLFMYGLTLLKNEPYLWDIKECYYNYPYHTLTIDLWFHYMISIGFEWLSIFTHFFEMKQKDYWHVLIHHIISLLLLHMSWILNFVRIGSVIILIQCPTKHLLEISNIAKYTNCHKLNNIISVLFDITWIFTHILFFPINIILSSWIILPQIIEVSPACHLFILLLNLSYFVDKKWTKIFKRLTLKIQYLSSLKIEYPKDPLYILSDEILDNSITESESDTFSYT